MDSLTARISLLESKVERLVMEAGDISTDLQDLKLQIPHSEEDAQQLPPPLPEVTVPTPESVVLTPEIEAPRKEPKPQATQKSVAKPVYNGGLELQLGRVWFVRIGIILLTTGLVFLSSYTYNNYVRDLAPETRLGLFYFLSALITGAGLFCETWKESLKSYGRIVAAGGLASIYYCSFTAYHVEALKVIENPIAASLLLTLSAGLFCGVSLWKQSRLMLSTSLGLAFYSVSINPNGLMVCVSSLILATFGITMMNRTKWMATGFVVLIGSYLSFIWWQITIAPSSVDTRFFLIAYWVLFVAASLLPRKTGAEKNQGIFSAINHSSFFLLFSLDLQSFTWIDHHWAFCLILGGALNGIGLLGRNRLPHSSIILHHTKGIGLITLGITLKFTGHTLFLTLLIESLLLLAVCFRHPHPFARLASQAVAALAIYFSLITAVGNSTFPSIAWTIAATLCLAYSVMDRLVQKDLTNVKENPVSIVAAILALGFIFFGSTSNWNFEQKIFLLATPGILAPFGMLNPRIRSFLFDTLIVTIAISPILLISLIGNLSSSSTFFTGAFMALFASAAHSYAQMKNQILAWKRSDGIVSGVQLAIAVLSAAIGIILGDFTNETQLIFLLFVPIVGTLIAQWSKLLIHSSIPALSYAALIFVGPVSAFTLFFGCVLSVGHLLILRNLHRNWDKNILEGTAYLISTAIFLSWILASFSQPLVLISWSATGLLLSARYFPKTLTSISASVYFFIGVFHLLPILSQSTSLAAYLALLAPASLHLWHSYKKLLPKFNLLAVGSFLGLWIQVTHDSPLSSLSAAWAITGTVLLLTGLLLRSRAFRLSALVILLFSLGRVMLVDIINLDPLPRILSFITLGLGLLVLGFVYNRWQERLKQIL